MAWILVWFSHLTPLRVDGTMAIFPFKSKPGLTSKLNFGTQAKPIQSGNAHSGVPGDATPGTQEAKPTRWGSSTAKLSALWKTATKTTADKSSTPMTAAEFEAQLATRSTEIRKRERSSRQYMQYENGMFNADYGKTTVHVHRMSVENGTLNISYRDTDSLIHTQKLKIPKGLNVEPVAYGRALRVTHESGRPIGTFAGVFGQMGAGKEVYVTPSFFFEGKLHADITTLGQSVTSAGGVDQGFQEALNEIARSVRPW